MDEYPLPPFVVLELQTHHYDLDRYYDLLLIDKKHNEILDCIEIKDVPFVFNPKPYIERFKQSLYDNGVI